VVEDEKEILGFVSRVLEFEGYDVCRAADGDAGLNVFDQKAVDLVILDLRLPACDGFDFLQKMKSRPSLAEVPVLILSASADASNREKAHSLGAQSYLVKPISIPDLKENVAGILGRQTSDRS